MKVAGLYQSAAKTHTMPEWVKDAETTARGWHTGSFNRMP